MVYLLMMQEFVGKPEAVLAGLRAIQDPQGESRGRGCRYRSPDKTFTPSAMAGFFIATKSGEHSRQSRLNHDLRHADDPCAASGTASGATCQ